MPPLPYRWQERYCRAVAPPTRSAGSSTMPRASLGHPLSSHPRKDDFDQVFWIGVRIRIQLFNFMWIHADQDPYPDSAIAFTIQAVILNFYLSFLSFLS
jgi:hypothetical protein